MSNRHLLDLILGTQIHQKQCKSKLFFDYVALQKENILERFRGPPKITKIEKGLPVKDVEQKLRMLVIFRVVPKSEYSILAGT